MKLGELRSLISEGCWGHAFTLAAQLDEETWLERQERSRAVGDEEEVPHPTDHHQYVLTLYCRQALASALAVGQGLLSYEERFGERELRFYRVKFPLFEIVQQPTIPLSEIRDRCFDMVDVAPVLTSRDSSNQVENDE